MSRVLVIISLGIVFGCATNNEDGRIIASSIVSHQSQGPAIESDWAQWVEVNAAPIQSIDPRPDTKDLEPLLKTIGNASVVGFGESDHGLHAIPQFRNRLFQFLVTRAGFKAIALESGVLEAVMAERYVQGENGVALDQALKEGVTHGMGQCQEAKDLLVWMRNYNLKQSDPNKKIHFFGFDLPVVGDAPILPLQQLSPYLEKMDPEYHAKTFPQLLKLADKAYVVTRGMRAATKKHSQIKYPEIDVDTVEIDPDYLDAYGTIGFDQLTNEEQAELESGIKNLITYMKSKTAVYAKLSSQDQADWNSHLAEIAAQHIRNLRSRQSFHKVYLYNDSLKFLKMAGLYDGLKVDSSYETDMTNRDDILAQLKGRESRELMAAENVEWAQNKYGKVFVYAHHGHLLKTPVAVRVGDIDVGKEGGGSQGIYMAEFYGPKYVIIGASVGTMTDSSGQPVTEQHGVPFEPVVTCQDCVEKAFVNFPDSTPAYFADLKKTTGGAREWLSSQDRGVRWQGGFQKLNILEGFDAVMYFTYDKPLMSIKR